VLRRADQPPPWLSDPGPFLFAAVSGSARAPLHVLVYLCGMDLTFALQAQAAALRATADALDALALAAAAPSADGSDWLDLPALAREYGLKRGALLAAADRGELTVSRGPRQKLLISRAEIERFLSAKAYVPRAPKMTASVQAGANDWDARAEAQLRELVRNQRS
jgi:hypothetical protein